MKDHALIIHVFPLMMMILHQAGANTKLVLHKILAVRELFLVLQQLLYLPRQQKNQDHIPMVLVEAAAMIRKDMAVPLQKNVSYLMMRVRAV
jgi:hypothetical protein